ncbi:phage holin family protein [Nodularia spumigena]|uniref:phage holin family protein n=1 Tax=Nodularia spumigena TaxID=70799 RepID=UPI00232C1D05|nr:phage holin family protein [Nodularia spumigena]MDB9303626.1 phage holin family protein [Nodularia spumigena CS-591/12]MDB9317882.1 phage holin family protein [Nodularia spumigena CS-590/01A]MDB9324123.1 phage holin family protein [Nodularia spumigena CS-591/07A]MDB9325846.1 phage holin family protein [Nodularia spumigena CS-590/02]MDB9331003.1 phage holin family protein [Nodularia spumigena CS-591/04]
MNIVTLLIVWVVTSISLLIISRLPFGVEVDSPQKAFLSAAVLGIVTAVVRPILSLIFTLPDLLTLNLLSGIFTFMIAVVCFSIAAWLVEGFRLRFGIWSAVLGAFALTIINSLIYKLLGV